MLLLHCWFDGQTLPHMPQLFSSKRVSMQVLLHRVRPVLHTQVPLTQPLRGPPPQLLLHMPQCCGLLWVLTHWPLQSVVPNGHWQLPAAQMRPGGQTLPHMPQFCWFACTSMQTPLHTMRPAVQ